MSSVDDSKRDAWAKMQADSRSRRGDGDGGNLKGGGGDGTSSDMEARIARLESDMEHVKKGVDKLDAGVSDIKKAIGDLRVDVTKGVSDLKTPIATLEERTKHFPTRWEAFLVIAAIVAVISGAFRIFAS